MEEKKMELTPEVKNKLKGFIGFQTDSIFKYVPKVFRDLENDIPKNLWPIFTLKSKDGIELAKIEDNIGDMKFDVITQETSMALKSGNTRITTLEYGIKKVNNFILDNGSVVSFENEELNIDGDIKKHRKVKEIIKLMPINLQKELQDVINERSELSQEELEGLE